MTPIGQPETPKWQTNLDAPHVQNGIAVGKPFLGGRVLANHFEGPAVFRRPSFSFHVFPYASFSTNPQSAGLSMKGVVSLVLEARAF